MSSLRKLEPKRRDMCGQLNGDCQESRPSPMNKVRTHRRDHEVDLHYTRSSATSPRSARHGLRATEAPPYANGPPTWLWPAPRVWSATTRGRATTVRLRASARLWLTA